MHPINLKETACSCRQPASFIASSSWPVLRPLPVLWSCEKMDITVKEEYTSVLGARLTVSLRKHGELLMTIARLSPIPGWSINSSSHTPVQLLEIPPKNRSGDWPASDRSLSASNSSQQSDKKETQTVALVTQHRDRARNLNLGEALERARRHGSTGCFWRSASISMANACTLWHLDKMRHMVPKFSEWDIRKVTDVHATKYFSVIPWKSLQTDLRDHICSGSSRESMWGIRTSSTGKHKRLDMFITAPPITQKHVSEL